MLLGVVSDTHGYFQPGLKELFRGVDRILHAGDIDAQGVLDALEEIAPVTAVRGNVDRGRLAADYPAWLDMEVEGHRLLLIHRGGRVLHAEATLAAMLEQVRPDIIVYGHTHQALATWED
ncbi:MAG TPA: YfcE family phosphodiesterase, partial [Anaerolineae bacterium]|nr:YfcE family phosphodiesterase [Anaerolineae bacterium]